MTPLFLWLRGAMRPDKTFHDVERGSNLDLILRGFNGAVNRFSDALSEGLHAIALALATKEDNSAEIREITQKVRASREALQESINKQKGE